VLVVDKLQTTQVLIVAAVLQVVHNQDVSTAPAVQLFDDIAADKTGTTSYDNHENTS
jgi:hypothetical protein